MEVKTIIYSRRTKSNEGNFNTHLTNHTFGKPELGLGHVSPLLKLSLMIDDIIRQVAEQVAKRRDEEILDVLGQLGHKFQTEAELHQYCKLHCRVEKKGNESTLFVDGEVVATWSEKITTTFEGNKINIMIG